MTGWHPTVRRLVYIILTVVGLVNGAALAYLAATETPIPTWLVGAGAAHAFLASATGFLAASNTPRTIEGQEAMHEVDALTTWPQRARDDDGDGIPDVAD